MKLYLSSFDIGNESKKLKELAHNNKAVIIMNALDGKSDDKRSKWLIDQTEKLSHLGFEVEELDLRKYFNKIDELIILLEDKGLVWVNGGNTFVLRRAMKESGFDEIIVNLVKDNSIVYGGFSAGVVVLHKDLHGLDFVDDPNSVPAGYNKEIIWDGLNLLDFHMIVHYKSDHPESDLVEKELEYCKQNNLPYKTLTDGDVFIVDEAIK